MASVNVNWTRKIYGGDTGYVGILPMGDDHALTEHYSTQESSDGESCVYLSSVLIGIDCGGGPLGRTNIGQRETLCPMSNKKSDVKDTQRN